jgi:small subunit ribosomal protein S20
MHLLGSRQALLKKSHSLGRDGSRCRYLSVDGSAGLLIEGPFTFQRRNMATHKSAEKRIRQTEKRATINRSRMSRVRTFVKKVETAIASGDKQAAQSAFQVAQPELHRAITKGVMHKNTVSRKLSRLAVRINAL